MLYRMLHTQAAPLILRKLYSLSEKTGNNVIIRGAFGKFLALSFISVTDLQTLSCLVSL